jgi:hypothetical protein
MSTQEDTIHKLVAANLELAKKVMELMQAAEDRHKARTPKEKPAPRVPGKPDLMALTGTERQRLRQYLKDKREYRWSATMEQRKEMNKRGWKISPVTLDKMAVKCGTTSDRMLKAAAVFFRWHPEP